ncbi:hypothetical protein [Acetobacterium wieringae]|uniref:hypothetical protein n=1 Tax=Acetobacterium wieringae TaxID=52694 RepID=UPI002B1E9BD6|nr:hypothetical protein [Acetobacterium wieringae]MEA4805128.1 hypothetical protein [Acetobacterium wieringae]
MDAQNLLCKLAGKKEAYTAMSEKTKFFNFIQKGSIGVAIKLIDEMITDLEEVSGLQAPVKGTNDKVVQIQHRRVAR